MQFNRRGESGTVMTLDELERIRYEKSYTKKDFLGLKKVGTVYLYDLQHTAEFYACEAQKRKHDLQFAFKKLSKMLKSAEYKKTEQEIESMSSETLADYVVEMLCEVCGYDEDV